MSSQSAPEITKHTGASYTCITFEPDLKRFGMQRLDNDIVQLMKKRVYDLAGTLPKVKVLFLYLPADFSQRAAR
jgi:DNA topoisomerase-2